MRDITITDIWYRASGPWTSRCERQPGQASSGAVEIACTSVPILGVFMADSTKPRALIIDPSLHSPDGHHLGVLQRFQTELANLQLGSVSLVSLRASEELGRKANLILHSKEVSTTAANGPRRVQRLRGEFLPPETAIKLRIRPELFVLPAADQATILGLAHYLKRHRRRKPPVILLWLMMAPHYKKSIDDPSIGRTSRNNEAFRPCARQSQMTAASTFAARRMPWLAPMSPRRPANQRPSCS